MGVREVVISMTRSPSNARRRQATRSRGYCKSDGAEASNADVKMRRLCRKGDRLYRAALFAAGFHQFEIPDGIR
jgi:hypothetical protein